MRTRRSEFKLKSERKKINKKYQKLNQSISSGRKTNPIIDGQKKQDSCSREKKLSELYKTSHGVGLRRSSHFVTYTQNGRLFYDIYTRNSLYQRNIIDNLSSDKPTIPLNSETKVKRKVKCQTKVSHKSLLDNVKSDHLGKRIACLNAAAKLHILSNGTKSLSNGSVDLKLNKSKSRSLNSFKNLAKKITSRLHKKLKRELGNEAQSVELVHGKRMASLNASAMINASLFVNNRFLKRKLNIKSDSCDMKNYPGAVLQSEEDLDDAVTEPMCTHSESELKLSDFVDDKATMTEQISDENVMVIDVQQKKSNLNSHLTKVDSSNPAIESFHSQRIIPLGGDTYGLQQITHQIVIVSSTSEIPSSNITPCNTISNLNTTLTHTPSGSLSFGQNSYLKQNTIPGDCFGLQFPSNQISYNQPFNHVSPIQTCSHLPQLLSYYPMSLSPVSSVNYPIQNGIFPVVSSSFFNNTNVPMFNSIIPCNYPIIYQPISNLQNPYFVDNTPFGYTPIYYPTAWMQTSQLPHQSVNLLVNNSPGSIQPPLIRSMPVLPINYAPLAHISHSSICATTSVSVLSKSTIKEPIIYDQIRIKDNKINATRPKIQTKLLNSFACESGPSFIASKTSPSKLNQIICSSPNSKLCTLENVARSDPKSQDFGSNYSKVDDDENDAIRKPVVVDMDSVNSWIWEGEPSEKFVFSQSDTQPILRKCYPAIRHERDGIVIHEKDSVLLCSGPNRSYPPHVAKITALYMDTINNSKMMSLLWYYRPEHLATNISNCFTKNELYSSRHRDTNPVDCIEDKAFVLSANAYARFMAKTKYKQCKSCIKSLRSVVPQLPLCELHNSKINPHNADCKNYDLRPTLECDTCVAKTNVANVFFCRGLYDYKFKRISRNPIFGTLGMPINVMSRLKANSRFYQSLEKELQNLSDQPSPINGESISRSLTLSKSIPTSRTHLNLTRTTGAFLSMKTAVVSKPIALSNSTPILAPLPPFADSSTGAGGQFDVKCDESSPSSSSSLSSCRMDNSCLMSTPTQKANRISHTNVCFDTPIASFETNTNGLLEMNCDIQLEDHVQTSSPLKSSSSINNTVDWESKTNCMETAIVLHENPNRQIISTTNDNVCHTNTATHTNCIGSSQCYANQCLPISSSDSVVTVHVPNHHAPPPHALHHPHTIQAATLSNWPSSSYDRSLLETSADLSVNWAEHGEQIALSLDCRVQDSNHHHPVHTSPNLPSHLHYPNSVATFNPSTVNSTNGSDHSEHSKPNLIDLHNHNMSTYNPVLVSGKRHESDSFRLAIL